MFNTRAHIHTETQTHRDTQTHTETHIHKHTHTCSTCFIPIQYSSYHIDQTVYQSLEHIVMHEKHGSHDPPCLMLAPWKQVHK